MSKFYTALAKAMERKQCKIIFCDNCLNVFITNAKEDINAPRLILEFDILISRGENFWEREVVTFGRRNVLLFENWRMPCNVYAIDIKTEYLGDSRYILKNGHTGILHIYYSDLKNKPKQKLTRFQLMDLE